MNKFQLAFAGVVLTASSAVTMAESSTFVVLDDFNVTQGPARATGPGATASDGPLADAGFPGSRTIYAEMQSGSGTSSTTATIDQQPAPIAQGTFSCSNDSGVAGLCRVTWSGIGGADISAGDTIGLEVVSNDNGQAAAFLRLTLTDTSGNSATNAQQTQNVSINDTPVFIDFALASFGGVNMSSIDSAVLEFDGTGTQDADLQGTFFGVSVPPVTPPPSVPALTGLGIGVGLLGLGLAGFVAARRRA